MAGLGFKDFQVGEVLTSSDVDGYLMQQTVMRFADAAARGSALGTAAGTGVPLAEGMVSYLDDVNQVQVYNGSTWTATARIAQVVQTVKTDTFTSSATSWTAVTGLSVNITPTSAANKVLVIAQIAHNGITAGYRGAIKMTRGGTDIYIGDTAGNRTRAVVGGSSGVGDAENETVESSIVFLDSPATTSSTTYQIEVIAISGSVMAINRSADDSDTLERVRGASSITVFEVAV